MYKEFCKVLPRELCRSSQGTFKIYRRQCILLETASYFFSFHPYAELCKIHTIMATKQGKSVDDELQRQALENQIKRLEQRISELKSKNKVLRDAKLNSEQETQKFVAYFQNEIESRDETIGELKRKCKKIETESSDTFASTKAYYESEIHTLKEASDRSLHETESKLNKALPELDVLAEFKENKVRVESRVEELEIELEEQERKHNEYL